MLFTPVGEGWRAVVPCAFVFFIDCESGSGASLDARGRLGWVLALLAPFGVGVVWGLGGVVRVWRAMGV